MEFKTTEIKDKKT